MVRKYILLFLLIFIIFPIDLFPQSKEEFPIEIPVIRMDRSKGLTPNYIYDLDMDKEGQLLLATYGSGILVYNGKKFTSLLPDSISDFPIVRRIVSLDREVVFVHHTGVWQYKDGWEYPVEVFSGNFMVYLIKKLKSGQIFISNNEESAILSRDPTGVFEESFRPFPFPLNDFLEVSDSLWIGLDYYGKVHRYNPLEEKLLQPLPIDSLIEKAFLIEDQLIFYSFDQIEIRDLNFKILKSVKLPEGDRFFTFMVDEGKLWMAGPTGIFIYENGNLAKVEALSGLASSQITKLFKTKDETVWMGTYQEGLFKLYDQNIQRILSNGESLGYVTNILPNPWKKDSFLVVTMNSLWEYSQNYLKQIELPDKPWFPNFEAAAITGTNKLLMGGRNVFFEVDLLENKIENIGIKGVSPTQFLKIVPLENGDILIGSLRGLFLVDDKFQLKKEFKNEKISPSNIGQISYFSDDLILFGNSVDLFIWKDGNLSTYDPEQVDGKVISHYPFSNTKAWFGTSAGKAVLFDLVQEEVLQTISSKLGKIVTTIGYAPDSSLLIATEIGPELVRKDGSVLVYDERVQAYEVPFNSYRFLENGDLLLGTINDLFLLKSSYEQKARPEPYLINLQINEQNYPLAKNPDELSDFTIQTGQGGKDFLFSINHIDYQDGENLEYSFKLYGLTDLWGPWQSDLSTQFTNIPYGEYELGVRVKYSDQQVVEYKFPYLFVVDPPFWRTPLGMVLVFFGIWILFYGLLNAFEKRNLQKNRKLSALISERNKEVLDINKNLEEIVRTRTYDLEKKNIELVKAIEEKNLFQRNEQIISYNTHDIVCLVDTSFTINLISSSLNQFLGISAEQVKGKHLKYILEKENDLEKLIEYLNNLNNDGGDSTLMLKMLHFKTGEELWIEIVGKKVFRSTDQELSGFVFNLRNVTERESLKGELNAVYKNIYRDFHDEVGNKLARIIALVSMAKLQLNEKIQIRETVDKVESTAKNLYRDTRDFIWSLDEENNNLDELSIQIRDFGEQLFDGSPVNFKYFSSGLSQVPLKPNRVRDILLIIKELLTNVLKHSKATDCALMVRKQGSQLLFLIYDNGIGLSSEKFEKGRGLKNILFRAERSHGQLIFKNKGRGTLVGIRIPLEYNFRQVLD